MLTVRSSRFRSIESHELHNVISLDGPLSTTIKRVRPFEILVAFGAWSSVGRSTATQCRHRISDLRGRSAFAISAVYSNHRLTPWPNNDVTRSHVISTESEKTLRPNGVYAVAYGRTLKRPQTTYTAVENGISDRRNYFVYNTSARCRSVKIIIGYRVLKKTTTCVPEWTR